MSRYFKCSVQVFRLIFYACVVCSHGRIYTFLRPRPKYIILRPSSPQKGWFIIFNLICNISLFFKHIST
jgi:hypothetical protein